MASGVTYDGVASTEGGNIFQDKSFWVAQRVPTRNDILSKIRNNGGVVVPLEKNADFLIADHARKDSPAGSYSWKFITESIQYGALQVEDRYRIGPDPNQPRSVGGAGLTRAGRVPFTHADKAALAKWVLSRPDLSRQGNELYQQWEKINSRHTWQSWRNHWVKALQPLDHHDLKMLAATAPDEELPQGSPPEQRGAATVTPNPENVVVRSARPAAAEESAPVPPSQGGRTEFTKDDDSIIATWAVGHSMVLTTNHFKELEEEQPHHSWESWRNRWNKRIRKYSVAVIEEMAATVSENTPGSNAQTTRSSSTTSGTPKAELVAQKAVESKTVHNRQATVKSQNTPKSIASSATEGRATTAQVKQAERTDRSVTEQRSDTSMTKVANGESVFAEQPNPSRSADDIPVESVILEAEVMTTETGQNLNTEGEAAIDDNEDEVEGELSQRDRFFIDLINFNGTDFENFEFPTLKGPAEDYEIDLYELARAYDTQCAAPEDIDWDEVARALGWETRDEGWLGPALQKCFEEQLMDFLEAMHNLHADNDPTELETRDTTMPSSPPVRQASPKRRREPGYIASTASVRKRRRLQDVEVPSTPDEQMGITRELRLEHGASVSPSLRRVSAQPSQQLPLLQKTPIRSRQGAPSSVRPLDSNGEMGGATGRKDQDASSEEDVPSLLEILRSKGKSKSGKTPRRSLPASFARPLPRAEPSRRTSAGQQMPSPRTNTTLSIDEPLETVSDWVDRHLRTGYPEHILNQALHHTSRVPGPSADHIVDSLANDNGIPADLPGVWLPHEDRTVKQLMATDFSAQASSAEELTEQKRLREEQRRLIERHTWEGLSKRKKYLRGLTEDLGEVVGKQKEMVKRPAPVKPPTLTQDEKKRREMELRRMMEDSDAEED